MEWYLNAGCTVRVHGTQARITGNAHHRSAHNIPTAVYDIAQESGINLVTSIKCILRQKF